MANVRTNKLKIGAKVKLYNGTIWELRDNQLGNIRYARSTEHPVVEDYIYCHRMQYAFWCNEWVEIAHTKDQLALREAFLGKRDF